MADALYLDADRWPLARLGDMHEAIDAGEANAALIAQATAIEDRFGLSPMSRRRLGVFLDRGTGATDDGPLAEVVGLHDARWDRATRPE